MEIKNNKSALAALATLGITAVAAGATAFMKLREKRKEQRALEVERQTGIHLTAEQMMVYNEAVRTFISLNDRIYDLRREREALQPLIGWLATNGEKPELVDPSEDICQLATDIERFLSTQVPFINASLASIDDGAITYADCVRGPVGGQFDDALDEEPTGAGVEQGQPITYVLRLGYYFPESSQVHDAVKALVVVGN